MLSRRARSLDQLLDNTYAVDIGYYVSRGWEILQRDLGAYIGFTILSGMINVFIALLPAIGNLMQLGVSGPLSAGPLIYAFKSCRGQEREFRDFLRGFDYWITLLVTILMLTCFNLLLLLPFALVTIAQMLGTIAPLVRDQVSIEQVGSDIYWQLLPWILFLGLSMVGIGYALRVFYAFAFPLILDRKLEFWPAMELSRRIISKRWGALLLLLLVTDLINLGGALLFLIGLLVTVPLTQCILAVAYEDIVGLEAESY